MPTFAQDAILENESNDLARRYFPRALLVSLLLHGIAVLIFIRFSTESLPPKPNIENKIYLTLVPLISKSSVKIQSPPNKIIKNNLETDLSYSEPEPEPEPASQPAKSIETSTLREEQPDKAAKATHIQEQKNIADHSAYISECTPLERKSKIHRCRDDNNEKWQGASSNIYQGAFAGAFQGLDQRSEFQKDMEKIIRLIEVQESIYALVESTGKEPEILAKEQLRISREIDRLLEKNQEVNLLDALPAARRAASRLLERVKSKK